MHAPATVRLNLCFFRSFLVFGAFVLLLLALQELCVRNLISRTYADTVFGTIRVDVPLPARKAVSHNGVVFPLTGT